MKVVKSDQSSIRKARMSRTARGNHGKVLRANIARVKFTMSWLFVTYTLPCTLSNLNFANFF